MTRAKFLRYEEVRVSGRTNMFGISSVMALSGLTKDECMDIMKNYSQYKEKYMPEEDN